MAVDTTGELPDVRRAPTQHTALAGLHERLEAGLRTAQAWLPRGRSLPADSFAARHRLLTTLLWAHAAGLPLYGVIRGYSVTHSVLEGGVIAAFAAAGSARIWPARWREVFTALGLIGSSAVLVHFSGGLIEAHFHFFVVVLILGLYEDWIPFLLALGTVLLHHGVVGQIDPALVYNHPDAFANPWKWAIVHSVFVAAAAAGAVLAWRTNEQARERVVLATEQAIRSQEANELKSRFVASASHELRTPLTSISGFTKTLVHRWPDTAERDKLEMLGIVAAQSERLQTLIEDLLLVSTVESGRVPVTRTSLPLAETLRKIVQELGCEEEVEVAVAPSATVCVDEQHLFQIVANLVANARRYGAPPVRISGRTTRSTTEIVVADRGPGVPEAFVAQLFESFTRAGPYRTDEGSGLGLSIVRGLAQANGGDIGYEPNTPRGARFRVTLPRHA